jgi:predicted nucleic acid-binding Zn ribbon protein
MAKMFQYQCLECTEKFEFEEGKIPFCPACLSLKVTKKITAPTVIYKGSGFYSTDHKKEDGKKNA